MKKKSLESNSDEESKVVVVHFCDPNGRHSIGTKHESSLHSSHEVIEMGPLLDFTSKGLFIFINVGTFFNLGYF